VLLAGIKFGIGFGLGSIIFSMLFLVLVAGISWLSLYFARLSGRGKTISSNGFILAGAAEQEKPVVLNFHWRWKGLNSAKDNKHQKPAS
jgi:hypothetical protein